MLVGVIFIIIIIVVITDPLNNYTELHYPLHLFSETYSSEMLIKKLPIEKNEEFNTGNERG